MNERGEGVRSGGAARGRRDTSPGDPLAALDAAVGLGGGVDPEGPDAPDEAGVLANRPFLLLWLSQVATQVGANMVIYGLTLLVYRITGANAAVSVLFLTFLVPGVLFSALAGVYVDRLDRRRILIATNVLRAAAFGLMLVVGDALIPLYLLNFLVSILTTFFAPAEASMIPMLVRRSQLIAANGLFTLTLNAAFAFGFALLGPLVVTLSGPEALIAFVGVLHLLAAVFCYTLPRTPRAAERISAASAVGEAGAAIGATVTQLREGFAYIRAHHSVTWSLGYLGIGSALIGILGVLGPDFATRNLGLADKDLIVVVLPLGLGIVTGVLLLGRVGAYVPRRRLIEGGLLSLGVLLLLLSAAGPLTRFLQGVGEGTSTIVDVTALISLLSVVVAIAFLAGVAYAFVLIPAQTQLQVELPEDVRGRVFGVLNTLVSVGSFVPIIVGGAIADVVGVGIVIGATGTLVFLSGCFSIARRPRRHAAG
ncbi:MAG: hypothetical protein RL338_1722 [Chloroflexota bacterium]